MMGSSGITKEEEYDRNRTGTSDWKEIDSIQRREPITCRQGVSLCLFQGSRLLRMPSLEQAPAPLTHFFCVPRSLPASHRLGPLSPAGIQHGKQGTEQPTRQPASQLASQPAFPRYCPLHCEPTSPHCSSIVTSVVPKLELCEYKPNANTTLFSSFPLCCYRIVTLQYASLLDYSIDSIFNHVLINNISIDLSQP